MYTNNAIHKKSGYFRIIIISAIFLNIVLGWSANAQINQPSELSPATEAGIVLPSLEELDAQIKELKEAKDQQADEDQKKQLENLLEVYEKASRKLHEIINYETSIAEFQNIRKQAPESLDAVKKQLEQISTEIKINEPFTEWSLVQIEQQVAQQEAELTNAKNNIAERELEAKQRSLRRTEIPQAVVKVKEALENIKKELAITPAPDVAPEMAKAKRILLLLSEKSLQREIESYTEEILSYDASRDLLAARKDLAARQAAYFEKLLILWQDILSKRRKFEAEQAAEKARQARRDAAEDHPLIRKLAEENTHLAELSTGSQGLIAVNAVQATKLNDIDKQLTELSSEFNSVKDKVRAVGLSEVIGVILLGKRNDLPDMREHRQNIKNRRAEITNAYFEGLKYEEQYSELADIEDSINAIFKELTPALDEEQQVEMRAKMKELLENKRQLLGALIREYDTYRRNLEALDFTERLLLAKASEYANYIDENILWVKDTKSINISTFSQAWQALVWLVSPRGWWQVLRAVWQDAKTVPFRYVVITISFAILFYIQKRIRDKIAAISTVIHKKYTDRFAHTLKVFVYTLILSASFPVVLYLLGWRLSLPYHESDFVNAIATGLRSVAFIYLALAFLRQISTPNGLAVKHFRMSEDSMLFLRRHVLWFMVSILPLVFIITAIEQQSVAIRRESLGRLAFIVALVILTIFFIIIIRPAGRLMKTMLEHKRGGWLDRLHYVWFPLSVILPLALALFAALGYYYAAQQFANCFGATIVWVLCLVIAFGLMVRWLTVTQNILAIKKERQVLKADLGQEPAYLEQRKEKETEPSEPQEDITQISLQMRRFIVAFLGLSLIVGLWLIWKDVLPALGIFKQVELWSTSVGENIISITLASLFLALIIILITIITARNFPGLLELVILQRLPLDRGVRFAIVTLTRYIIVIVGIVMAFGKMGLGWSKVQWLVAAVTVGLGFGLQEIFANFVSGLIILFEQPMRVGDIVTVGDVSGKVTRIQIRATTIRKWDRKELVVPNKEFITGRLINWTLSDTILRMDFSVGIAYGSNTVLAEKTLLEIAHTNQKVLSDPEPFVIFKGFGNSALEFELRLYIPDLDSYLFVWHEVNRAIDDAFRQAGIEIAFPQRDIHVRSIKSLVPVEMQNRLDNQDK